MAIGKSVPEPMFKDAEVEQMIAKMLVFREQNHGCPMSARRAATLLGSVASLRSARAAKKLGELSALRKNNETLKAKVKALTKEVDRLKARLAVYENLPAPKRPRSPAARPNA